MSALTKTLLPLLLLAASLPLAGQYRSELRTAEKQMELNAYNLAIESYLRVLSYRPDDPEALAQLGMAHRMLNQMDSARVYFERAMVDRKVEPATLLAYAQTLTALGDYARAEPLFVAYGREADATVGNHFAGSAAFAMRQQSENAGFRAERLSTNSVAADFGASIPQPGRLVFSSSRADEDFDGVSGNRPYVATLAPDGTASDPVPVNFGYQPQNAYVGPVSYSPDGRQVVFTRNNFTPGTRMVPEAGITLSLMIADVNMEGRWTNVRPLPFNGTGFSSGFGTFGTDDRTIYFASDRSGGFGGYDIYRATYDGQRWSEVPENVGRTVNSRGNEITPYFDGSSLFFSSDWHPGLGSYDVFRAELDGLRPVTLFHMGNEVNSSRDDYGFIFDPAAQRGYVTSNRKAGRDLGEDIYLITPRAAAPPPTVANNTPTEAGSAPVAGTPQGVTGGDPVPFGAVRGYVTDIRTNAPVPDASVVITRRSDSTLIDARTDVKGAYYATLEPYTTYDVAVTSPGYEPISFPITSDGGTKKDLLGNIMLLPAPEPEAEEMRPDDVAPVPAPATYEREAAAPQFAVQIASLAARPAADRFSVLAPLGSVYTVEEGGRTKVRLGAFATLEEAKVAVTNVRNLGYEGSFALADTAAQRAYLVESDRPSPVVAEPSTPAAAPEPASAAYRVQLGAFGKPENFNRDGAGQLGRLENEVRGNLTVFYIDGIASEEAARQVRDRAREMGYEGAYVLQRTDAGYQKL